MTFVEKHRLARPNTAMRSPLGLLRLLPMTGRNFLLARSIAFGAVTKLIGSAVIFLCMPLAAVSLSTTDYATFTYSMAVTALAVIIFSPIGSSFVVRVAHVASADHGQLARLAQTSFATYLTLGLGLALPAAMLSYWLSPPEHALQLTMASLFVLATAVFSWAEVFRLATRRDHISSLFSLANNLTIVGAFTGLYHFNALTLDRILFIYYFSPLFWALCSCWQLLRSIGARIRLATDPAEWRQTIIHSRPNMVSSVSDYIKIYGASALAFYLTTPQSYSAFSTVQLLIARLTNPISLFARPLIPAYIDAMARNDLIWIRRLKTALVIFAGAGLIGSAIFILGVATGFRDPIRLGVITLGGHELLLYAAAAALLLLSTLLLFILNSIYLAQHQMHVFSRMTLIANIVSVAVGCAITLSIGPVGMFLSVSLGSLFVSLLLMWRFVTSSVQFGGLPR